MLFANNCNTTLNGGITAIATSMVVTSATGFPAPTGSQYFYCTLADAATQTTIEIVKITAVSGTTFTIVRGQDGTTGTIFASGAVVSLRLVAANLNDFPKLDEVNTFSQAQTFSALTTGRITFSGTGGLQSDSANLFWDNTNKRLGIGTASPANSLNIVADNTSFRGQLSLQTVSASNLNQFSWYNQTVESATIYQDYSDNSWNFINIQSAPITFSTTNIERMRLFASGGVSIGNTTDPSAGNLSVNGNLSYNGGYGSVAPVYGCRAWCNFNATGTPAIRSSGNCSSISSLGTGYWGVNLTNAMPDKNYSAVVSAGYHQGATTTSYTTLDQFGNQSTSSIRFYTQDVASIGYAPDLACISVFR